MTLLNAHTLHLIYVDTLDFSQNKKQSSGCILYNTCIQDNIKQQSKKINIKYHCLKGFIYMHKPLYMYILCIAYFWVGYGFYLF